MLSGTWEDIQKWNEGRRKRICGTVGIAGKMQRDGDGDRSQHPFSRSPGKEKNVEEDIATVLVAWD